MLNFKEWLIAEADVNKYMPMSEFMRRLQLIGWVPGKKNGSHISYMAPPTAETAPGTGSASGKGMISFSTNNYEKNFISIARDVYRQFPDIKSFFFNQNFEIPKNFDYKKQQLTVAGESEVISVLNLFKQISRSGQDAQSYLAGKRVNKSPVELADFHSGKLEVIFANGESKQFDFNQNIELSAA